MPRSVGCHTYVRRLILVVASVFVLFHVQAVASENETDDSSKAPVYNATYDEMLAKNFNEECAHLWSGHLEDKFMRDGLCFSRKRVQEIIIDLVGNTTEIFKAHGIESFLESGTLLGSYRHKSIIPYDQDADIGITQASFEKLQAAPLKFPPEYFFEVYDSKWHPQGSRFIQLPTRVIHRESALYVDIFVYKEWPEEGSNSTGSASGAPMIGPMPSGCFIYCKNCPKVGGDLWEFKVPNDWIYPLQDCPFAHLNVKCPNKPEKYLAKMFGEDFMVPDRLE